MAEETEAVEAKYEVQFDGDEMKREFIHGDGRAEAKFVNGDTYAGYYVQGKRHGKGVYTWAGAKPASYDGDWNQGQRHGNGIMIYPDGSQYDGQWTQDRPHGSGIYLYSNGDRFLGEFDNGLKHGLGTYVYGNDGAAIRGRWIQGKLVNGQWTTKDGVKISGAFNDHIPDGEVHFVFPNGNQQNGTFVNGYWQPGEVSGWD